MLNRFLKFHFPLEAFIWISGLILLPVLLNAAGDLSVCPFHNIGITFCPGCGLGESIVHLYKLNLSDSLSAHPIGIPALLIILHRIFSLTKHS